MDYELTIDELINRLSNLLSEFCNERAVLLQQNPHEDAIGDELKPYLRKYFSDFPYDVNHNYDLMHSGNELVKKAGEFLLNELPKRKIPKGANLDAKTIEKEILPDFIFHDLQSRDHNFLMIEIKKSTNKSKDDRQMDLLKLKTATNGYLNYDYGAFIDITTGEEYDEEDPFSFTVYEGGEVVYEE